MGGILTLDINFHIIYNTLNPEEWAPSNIICRVCQKKKKTITCRERHRAMTLVLDKVVEDVASKAVNKISPPTSMLRMRLPNTRSEEEA